jgi:hypothetical protein
VLERYSGICLLIREGRDNLEDIDIDGRIILKWILSKRGCEIMNWILLFQDRTQWLALVNTVTNIWAP